LRKLFVGAITGAVMLAVAAIAMATTTQTFTQKYTSPKKSTSVGTSFQTASSEDANAENNHQPKAAREFDITFPKGTKINYKAAPVCAKIDESAQSPCPKNTQVGTGAATALLPTPGTPPIESTVTAYNRKNGLFLYVQPSIGNPIYLSPTFKGLTLKTTVAPICIASTNQNGHCVTNTGGQGQEVVLTKFSLKTKAIKKGKKIYIKSPKTCPKGGWKFQAAITYSDGTTVKPSSLSPCKK
jgi:hypothetical protein